MKIDNVTKILVMTAATAIATSATAAVIDEVEMNNSVSTAQAVSSNSGNIEVNATMGFSDQPQVEDLDFFQFSAKAGDALTLATSNASFNSRIAVYGAGPDYKLLRMNDGEITEFVAPASGAYTVAVGTTSKLFFDGGATGTVVTTDMIKGSLGGLATTATVPSSSEISDYRLSISGISPIGPKKINIEVKPGSKGTAPMNPRSKGKIPVAILGSSSFSAINVDTSSLTFGSSGDEQSLSKCAKSGEDVNGDGHYDLVCHFENQQADFKASDLEGILRGKTRSGEAFEGRAPLKMVPAKAQ